MQNKCSNKKAENGKKVVQVYMSDDKSISEDEDLSEYWFKTNDDIKCDLQYVFNKLYNDFLFITRKNKELKKIVESL